MNAFYQSAEPTHTCKSCGATKLISMFVRCTKSASGYRPLCNACKSIQNAAHRAKRSAKVVQEVQASRAAREANPDIVPPRTFVPASTAWVPQDAGYVRNNGNKHIPSKGFRT